MKRTRSEWIFIFMFIPSIISFYAIYKYPEAILGQGADTRILGKSLSFWYSFSYTAIVCSIAAKVLVQNKNSYSFKKNITQPLSSYQKKKFTSIFIAQLVGFFLVPYVLLPIIGGKSFWHDELSYATKSAHVYLYPGFKSWGMAVYLFIVIPVGVWFFGKRYCSWICSCGNLAETVGVTVWGKRWVKEGTPRGEKANKNHIVQLTVMIFAITFGVVLFFDSMKIVAMEGVILKVQAIQDFFIDFMFGSVAGVAAYPFWGTRIWCRYGCPLAKFMELSGKISKSNFQVAANEKCTGIGLCTQACPMGIDVASYAHLNKKPTMGSFGLQNTICIGCGGCIDVCPTQALSFK